MVRNMFYFCFARHIRTGTLFFMCRTVYLFIELLNCARQATHVAIWAKSALLGRLSN